MRTSAKGKLKMAKRPHLYSELWVDQSAERTSWSLNLRDTVDIEATTADPLLTALSTAVGAFMELGDTLGYAGSQLLISAPTAHSKQNSAGNREDKFLLEYHDDITAQKFVATIPMRKSGVNPPPGSDYIDIATGVGAALKTAFDAVVVAPVTGNTATLDAIKLVGRNV